jgi:hypothetical protein
VPDPADLPDPAPAQPVGDPSAAQPEREAAVARRLLETELRLREATLDVYQSLGLFPNRDLQYAVSDAAGIPGNTGVQPPWYQQNTKRGEVIPVYRTEQELRLIQDRMRVICNYNEFAICALENRVNYVVGDGFTYSATAKDPHNKAHQKSADAVQVVIDRWCEINDSSALEAEALWRLDTEGEAIIRGFRGKDGYIHQRFVEPEHVRPPTADTADPVNSFGVITKRDDIQTVEGYWIVNDPLNNPLPVRVSADKVLHLKLNVRSTAKRGLPTFFPVEANLRRCEDLLASMTSVAKARAKIALIRKITGLTSATADSLLSKLSAVRANDPATGETLNIERLRYGTVLTASGNTEYQMPSVQLGASAISSRCCRPNFAPSRRGCRCRSGCSRRWPTRSIPTPSSSRRRRSNASAGCSGRSATASGCAATGTGSRSVAATGSRRRSGADYPRRSRQRDALLRRPGAGSPRPDAGSRAAGEARRRAVQFEGNGSTGAGA